MHCITRLTKADDSLPVCDERKADNSAGQKEMQPLCTCHSHTYILLWRPHSTAFVVVGLFSV